VPFKFIGDLFEVDGRIIWNHWKEYKLRRNELKMPGRPAALSPSEVDDIVETINRSFYARRPLSLPEIVSVISTKFAKSLLHDTLYYLRTRDPRIKTCWGKPIDERRMKVINEAISTYFVLLMSTASGTSAHFVFNMGEMGHQSWLYPCKN
jgi:hypothetical protein